MHTQPDNANNLEPDASSAPQPTVGSQPWWRGSGYNSVPPTVLGDTMSESPSLELPNGAKTSQPQANGGLDEGSDINKETQTANAPDSGSNGNCRQEQQHLQHAASTVPPTMGGYLVSQPQLVGHSVACAPYPYSDQYCAGVFTAYGNQALVHPYLLGMHHTRMPLPLEMAEEPVYVNAKQYHGILRRRQSRAKAELEKKVIKDRKPYLHESRHQHAMRRTRGCGGRFLNTKNVDNATSEKAMDSCTATSTQPTSEPVPSEPPTYSNGDENGC